MPKLLCILGLAVAGLLLLFFVADLSIGFPFKTASKTMDIGLSIGAAVLGYLSWSTWREQT